MFVRFFSPFALALAPLACAALPAGPAAAQASDSLDFPLDQAQRERNWDTLAEELAAADSNAAGMVSDIRAFLRKQNVIDPYMAGYGLSSADLGDVLALAQFSAVILANRRTDDPTQAQVDGIRAAITQAGAAELAALSAPEKQGLADRVLFIMVLQNAIIEALEGQPAREAWLDAFASTNSEMLGFDVAQVRIGPNGFDRSASASQAAPQDSRAALAAGPAGAGMAASPVTPSATRLSNGRESVLGVGYETTMVFVPGFGGGGLNQINTLTTLMKDGRACEDCLTEVLDGTLASFAAENPNDMGRWRKAGAGYLVTFSDGDTREIEAKGLHGPAPAGAQLSGRFKGVSGTSIGIASTLRVDFLDFMPGSRFLFDGSTSSIGAYAIAAVDRAAQSGRYSIDGFRITFEYASGKREEASFVLYDTDDEFILIDGQPHFIPDD
ncbi:MAG: hypothetical protein AAF707_05425 [Pseudomonadota bacterium]